MNQKPYTLDEIGVILSHHSEFMIAFFVGIVLAILVGYLYQKVTYDNRGAFIVVAVIFIAGLITGLVLHYSKPRNPEWEKVLKEEAEWKKQGGGQAYSPHLNTDSNSVFATKTNLNLRKGPSTTALIIKVLKKGDYVLIRQQRRNVGKWVFAETEDRRHSGYVHSDYLVTIPRGERGKTKVLNVLSLLWLQILNLFSMAGLVGVIASVIVSVLVFYNFDEDKVWWISGITFALTNKILHHAAIFSVTFLNAWKLDYFISIIFEIFVGCIIGVIVYKILD